jgi:galactokinase
MTAHTRATDAFSERFGRSPEHLAHAPGRIELLGNHTDYNDGLVLSAAIDRTLVIAAARRPDGRIRLHSLEQDEAVTFDADAPDTARLASWARYPAGVIALLGRRGVAVPGFDAVIASDVPIGAGLSSSAAVEVATALAVRALSPFRLAGGAPAPLDDPERWQLAALCRAAEHEFAGVPVGLLDQVSVLFGARDHALLLDCRAPSVERLPLRGAALVVCDSGDRHALDDGRYAEIRDACVAAARHFGVAALRDVPEARLARMPGALGAREQACARHVVEEIARVARAADALRGDDLPAFGRLMVASHASSRTLLGNSTPALDLLVELALAMPGCLGARLTGGGFGGATVTLARPDASDAVMETLPARFAARTGRRVAAWNLRVDAGAA